MLPLIFDNKPKDYQHKELCISQVFNYIMGVNKDWKFVFNISNGKLLELYNRSEDFYENHNLANVEEGKRIGKDLLDRYFNDLIPNSGFKPVDILKSLKIHLAIVHTLFYSEDHRIQRNSILAKFLKLAFHYE